MLLSRSRRGIIPNPGFCHLPSPSPCRGQPGQAWPGPVTHVPPLHPSCPPALPRPHPKSPLSIPWVLLEHPGVNPVQSQGIPLSSHSVSMPQGCPRAALVSCRPPQLPPRVSPRCGGHRAQPRPLPSPSFPRDPAAPGAAPAPPQPLEFSLPPSPVPAELSRPELPQSCCHSDADTEQGPALAPRVPDYPRVTARLQHLQAILKCFFPPPHFLPLLLFLLQEIQDDTVR